MYGRILAATAVRYKNPIIFLTVLTVFIIYVIFNGEDLSSVIRQINPVIIVTIAILYIASLAANGIFIKSVLRPFGKRVSLLESFYISIITSIGNFFAPAGSGLGIRAVYLKKKHNLSYRNYVSITIGNYALVILLSSMVGLISLWVINPGASALFWVVTIFFLGLIISCIAFMFYRGTFKARSDNKAIRKLLNIASSFLLGWQKIVNNKRLLMELCGITVFNFTVIVIINWLLFVTADIALSVAVILLYSVFATLSIFINITPANIGVKEAIYAISASLFGLSLDQILLLAVIDRSILFLVLVLSWLFLNANKQMRSLRNELQSA